MQSFYCRSMYQIYRYTGEDKIMPLGDYIANYFAY